MNRTKLKSKRSKTATERLIQSLICPVVWVLLLATKL